MPWAGGTRGGHGSDAAGGDKIIKIGFESSVTRGAFIKVFPARNLCELRADRERCLTPVRGHS